MSAYYEWQIINSETDFFEVNDKLSKFTSEGVRTLLSNQDSQLILVRYGAEAGSVTVNTKCRLPTIFDNGCKVPQRFKLELAKWQKRGFRG